MSHLSTFLSIQWTTHQLFYQFKWPPINFSVNWMDHPSTFLSIQMATHQLFCQFNGPPINFSINSMDHPSNFLSIQWTTHQLFYQFNGPLINVSIKDSLMDCFINLSFVTRDITWFLSFLFSLCNKTTTEKTEFSEVKHSGWSPCFPLRNFCATGRYSRCSCVVPSETNVNMHSKRYCKIDIF